MLAVSKFVILIMKFLSFMFTLAICAILMSIHKLFSKTLLIQRYHTTCVSFSCQFIMNSGLR